MVLTLGQVCVAIQGLKGKPKALDRVDPTIVSVMARTTSASGQPQLYTATEF